MLNKDIGMNIDQVLVVERPGISPRDREARNSAISVFRAEVKKKTQYSIPVFVGYCLAVLVAFLTVGFQGAKAALANPIESLRSE